MAGTSRIRQPRLGCGRILRTYTQSIDLSSLFPEPSGPSASLGIAERACRYVTSRGCRAVRRHEDDDATPWFPAESVPPCARTRRRRRADYEIDRSSWQRLSRYVTNTRRPLFPIWADDLRDLKLVAKWIAHVEPWPIADWIGLFDGHTVLGESPSRGSQIVHIERQMSLTEWCVGVGFLEEMQLALSETEPDDPTLLELGWDWNLLQSHCC